MPEEPVVVTVSCNVCSTPVELTQYHTWDAATKVCPTCGFLLIGFISLLDGKLKVIAHKE